MSELSKLFIKQGYHIDREMTVGPASTRIWATKGEISYMIDFTTQRSLLLSVGDYSGWKKALANARKICTQFMGAEPICRYDAKPTIQWTHFMEWDLVHPEERLRIIVNRGEDLAQVPFRDLLLFGNYCIGDFEDAALKQAYLDAATLRKKFPGVYGKDPGECDVVRVAQASEFGLFLEYTLLENIRAMQKKYQGTARPIDDFYSLMTRNATVDEFQDQHIALALDYVAAIICQKIGISILEEPSSAHRLFFDKGSFVKWFNYHSRHLMTVCPDDESLSKLIEDYQQRKDVSAYAPQGNWRTA